MSIMEKTRTRLRDMLFGRTQIKVVESVDPDVDCVPTFLIGTFRSGTTLFRYLLDSHTDITSPPETKFLVHFAEMYGNAITRNALGDMGYDEEFLRCQILRFANSIYGTYQQSYNARLLVDKTPEYTRCLDFIDWLYKGRCRYVVIYRNGLDVTQSMLSVNIDPLEGNKTTETAFEYWKHDTEALLAWEESLPDRCHRVLYDNLCDDTEKELAGVMDFLGYPFQTGQMQWYDKNHAVGAEDIKARRQRKINKSTGNYQDWPQQVVLNLKERAAEVHQAIGFDPQTLKPVDRD